MSDEIGLIVFKHCLKKQREPAVNCQAELLAGDDVDFLQIEMGVVETAPRDDQVRGTAHFGPTAWRALPLGCCG